MKHECFFCGVKFTSQHELVGHTCLGEEQMEIKEYMCTYCGKRGFYTLDDVLEHEEECQIGPQIKYNYNKDVEIQSKEKER